MNKQRGFTLLELIVVITIIGLLVSVILASLSVEKAKSRDARRLSDLNQIRIAIELYSNDKGHLPRESADSANGRVGEGGGLDTLLAPYMSVVPMDPLGPGNANYYYYYDGRQLCGGSTFIAVLFARKMESYKSNYTDTCTSWGGEGGAGQPGSRHVYLGESDG